MPRKPTPTCRACARASEPGVSFYYDDRKGLHVADLQLGLDERGRRSRKTFTAREHEPMIRKLRRFQQQRDDGRAIVDERMTVGEWCEHYIAEILPYQRRNKGAADRALVLRTNVIPYVGRKRLAELAPVDVRRMMRALEARPHRYQPADVDEPVTLSPDTVAKARSCLSAALTAAMREQLVTRNVVQLTDLPAGAGKARGDDMTPEQVDAVLACSAAGVPHKIPRTGRVELRPDRLYALAVLVLAVGLRQAEALDLTWHDVDLDAGTLDVYVGRDDLAKSAASVRTIPLHGFVLDALRAHKAEQRVEQMAAKTWHDGGLVFPSTIGTRLDRRNVLRWWHALTTRAGVGRQTFHGARHTAATVMYRRGVPIEGVSAILGHARTDITRRFYARADVELLRAQSAAMSSAYTMPERTTSGSAS